MLPETLYLGVILAVVINHWMHTRIKPLPPDPQIEQFLRHCEYLRSRDQK